MTLKPWTGLFSRFGSSAKNSLERRTLINVAIRVGLVIAIMTGIFYWHVVNVVTEQTLSQLQDYINERGQRERAIFKLANNNHTALKEELLHRLDALGSSDPQAVFDREFVRFAGGATHNRLERFNGERTAGVFIGKNVTIDADIRQRVVTLFDMANQYGPVGHHLFQNVYFTTPENIIVEYWPEVPDWATGLKADYSMVGEEWFDIADVEHNPSRESKWTGMFYDDVSGLWMTSIETPVDRNGRHIATIGHDVPVNETIDRSISDTLEGAYNMIIRNDGRLIVHPDKMDAIKAAAGHFNILESDDAELKTMYAAITNRPPGQTIIEGPNAKNYLAIAEIPEPGWFFITVYPKSIVSGLAFDSARIILFLGLASLLLELVIFFDIIRRQVIQPLNEMVRIVSEISKGNMDLKINSQRNDELGVLANSIDAMGKQLKESHNDQVRLLSQLNAFFNESPIGMVIYDADGRHLKVNHTLSRMSGIPAELHLGKTLFELLPHEVAESFDAARHQVMDTGKPVTWNVSTVLPEATRLEQHFLTTFFPIPGPGGRPVAVGGGVIDISELKHIQSAMERLNDDLELRVRQRTIDLEFEVERRKTHERKYRSIIATAAEGYWLIDHDLNTLEVNEALCDILRTEPERMVGKNLTSFTTDEGRQILESQYASKRSVRQRAYEIPLIDSAGNIRQTRFSTTTHETDEFGNVKSFFAFVTDITDEKLFEQAISHFRMMLDQTHDAVFMFEPDGMTFTYANQGAIDQLGYNLNELFRMHPYDIKPDIQEQEFRDLTAKLIKGPQRAMNFETHYLHKTGKLIPVEVSLQFVSSGSGESRIVGISRDISERKELQSQLVQSSKLATLGEMATGMAHELNQPLNIIRMAAQNIQRKAGRGNVDPEYLVEKLNKITSQVIRASSIIDHMRIFGRKDSGKPEPLCPVKTVHGALDLINQQLRLSSIEVQVETDPDCRAVFGHAIQLEQVMLNLLSNARDALNGKAAGNRKIHIRIDELANQEKIRIQVADNAGGISEDIIDRIFEPFYTTKEIGRGTGLGLSISFGIITEMGGDIRVTNKGGGAEFTIELPVANAPDKTQHEPGAAVSAS